MSSLQKFHRRTASFGPAPFEFATIGSGNNTVGYWLGTTSYGKQLIVAPKSTENQLVWVENSYAAKYTFRGFTSTTDGLGNSNSLYALVTTGPGYTAVQYMKTLSTGGYNTWYLPAIDELANAFNTGKTATPFATSNSFAARVHWSSTEYDANRAVGVDLRYTTAGQYLQDKTYGGTYGVCRAVRRHVV
jgi:hypothetical protein